MLTLIQNTISSSESRLTTDYIESQANQPATENTKLPRHHDIGTELNSQTELNGDKNVEPEPLSIRWPPSGGLSYYFPVIAGVRNFQRPILCLTKRAKSVKLKIGL